MPRLTGVGAGKGTALWMAACGRFAYDALAAQLCPLALQEITKSTILA